MLRATGPNDPRLPAFIEYWLGRGAPVSPGAGTAEIVTRLSTHSRPSASEISTSHTQVLRPR